MQPHTCITSANRIMPGDTYQTRHGIMCKARAVGVDDYGHGIRLIVVIRYSGATDTYWPHDKVRILARPCVGKRGGVF